MSMLSAQIDHLRELADALDGKYGHQGYAIAMRDAADTIWQLCDDLQRANAAVQDAEHDESMAWDRVRKAEAENERLRELVTKMRYGATWTHEAREYIEAQMRELGVEVDDG